MAAGYDRAVDMVRAIYDRRISGPPVLDLASDFAGGAAFVDNWQAIRDEALNVARDVEKVPRFHEIMPEQADISANDGRDWRMYIMKAYGVEQPRRMAACPRLTALVKERPEVLSCSFSFLGPGKHIPPHRGPIRGIIRFYMMLSMPRAADGRPAAVLRVADTEHRLENGQYLLWDDTFEHEAWNSSDEVRIVLSLDVWRPRMPLDMKILSAAVVLLVRAGMMIRGLKG
jgi:aspartate beta-hydroxylase